MYIFLTFSHYFGCVSTLTWAFILIYILTFPFLSIKAADVFEFGNPFKNWSWENENFISIYLSDRSFQYIGATLFQLLMLLKILSSPLLTPSYPLTLLHWTAFQEMIRSLKMNWTGSHQLKVELTQRFNFHLYLNQNLYLSKNYQIHH